MNENTETGSEFNPILEMIALVLDLDWNLLHDTHMKYLPHIICTIAFFFLPLQGFSQEGQMLEKTSAKGPVWLGVQLLPDQANEPGARISGIMRNSPTDGIGIRPGDRIVEFEQKKIPNAETLNKLTKAYRDGDQVEIKFLRITTTRKATVTLRSMPDEETIIRRHLIGQKAPQLEFLNGGKLKNLESQKGKITVVDFFATWCAPCRETDKQLAETRKIFGEQVSILSISSESEERVNKLLKKSPKEGILVGVDTANASEKTWHVTAYPTVVLLDKEHNIVSVMFGVKEVNLLNERIKKLLKNQ